MKTIKIIEQLLIDVDGVKAKIGEKKFNKLSQRAEAYFAEFKNLLDALLDNGMIPLNRVKNWLKFV